MSQVTNPSLEIAHLGHVEMLTNCFDDSLDFFTRVYGLKLSGQDVNSAYLRAWDDYEFHTLMRNEPRLKTPRPASPGHHRGASTT